MLIKARELDSISMPLLLQEGYTDYEIREFTEALYLTIESLQRSTDFSLKVIRLTAEDQNDIMTILKVIHDKQKPVAKH